MEEKDVLETANQAMLKKMHRVTRIKVSIETAISLASLLILLFMLTLRMDGDLIKKEFFAYFITGSLFIIIIANGGTMLANNYMEIFSKEAQDRKNTYFSLKKNKELNEFKTLSSFMSLYTIMVFFAIISFVVLKSTGGTVIIYVFQIVLFIFNIIFNYYYRLFQEELDVEAYNDYSAEEDGEVAGIDDKVSITRDGVEL